MLWPPKPLKDQVVELSIKLKEETYNDALRDPSSFRYQQLARHFIRRVKYFYFDMNRKCKNLGQ